MSDKLSVELFQRSELNPKLRSYQMTMDDWNRLCLAYKFICDRDPRLYSYDHRGPKNSREFNWKNSVIDDDDDYDGEEGDDVDDDDKEEEDRKKEKIRSRWKRKYTDDVLV